MICFKQTWECAERPYDLLDGENSSELQVKLWNKVADTVTLGVYIVVNRNTEK